jgi:predicted negative regulator of RcsB-dependent stress response
VEIYQTEEQQVEAIKSFWAENGTSIIAGLAIGFAGFIGFNYYQEYQLAEQQKTADSYMGNLEQADKEPASFNQSAEAFISKNPDSSYASLTALTMAKNVLVHDDYSQAAKYLQTAIDKAPNTGIKAIATMRLVHVQIQLAQYEEALANLATTMPKSFTANIEESKGDIYVLQGKNDLARNAYQAAIDNDGLKTSPALQMKIDDLAIALN